MNKTIGTGDRCVVGITIDGRFSVWHKVMGKGTPPKFVDGKDLAGVVNELLVLYKQLENIRGVKE
jgi:hypothetical protein